MLLFAPLERHAAIREQLNMLIQVPFQFEFNGSQIIFFDHEVDYSAAESARCRAMASNSPKTTTSLIGFQL